MHKRIKTSWLVTVSLALFLAAGYWFGPYSSISHECAYCGKCKRTKSRLGITYFSEVTDTEVSEWLKEMGGEEHEHFWIAHSCTIRSRWFGAIGFGCGPGPLSLFYRKRNDVESSTTLKFIRDFQSKIATSGKTDALRFLSEQQLEELIYADQISH